MCVQQSELITPIALECGQYVLTVHVIVRGRTNYLPHKREGFKAGAGHCPKEESVSLASLNK